ncbi:hypothetical protein D3C80_1467630 [compost metagenome]
MNLEVALDGLVLAQLLVEAFLHLDEGIIGDAPLHPLVDEVTGLVVGGQHPNGAPLQHGVEIPQHGFGELRAVKSQGAALLFFLDGGLFLWLGAPDRCQRTKHPDHDNP